MIDRLKLLNDIYKSITKLYESCENKKQIKAATDLLLLHINGCVSGGLKNEKRTTDNDRG